MEKHQEFGENDLDTPSGQETTDPQFHSRMFRQEPPEEEEAQPPIIGEEPGSDEVENTDLAPQFLKRTGAALKEPESPSGIPTLPHSPRTLAEVGLSKPLLVDLTLKIIHYAGTPSTTQLVRRLGLSPALVQHLLSALKEERLVEVQSQSDLYTGNYRYRLSERGSQRTAEALERSRYAGPAPVTAEQYIEVMRLQRESRQPPSRELIKDVLNELVLSPEVGDALARALYAGKTAILHGPSGNGKTSILDRFARNPDGTALVPYAIYAYGQVIRVFDQSIHDPLEDMDSRNVIKDESKMDRRWVLVQRPAVMLGAEIGQESLEMAYDPQSRFYQAPPHIKAQGGVLIVDDFGRQKIDTRELLTRWLIPLERGWDTLTLITGEKVTLPFSAQLLLATNLDIHQLADDALLRRILYKVEIPSPRPEEFAEILRRICRQKQVLVPEGILDFVVERLYSQPGMEPRASHARDLLEMVLESAAFDGRDPVLDRETFERVYRMFADQHGARDPAS